MADESLEDFKKRTGAVGGGSAAPANGDSESLDDFKKRTGAVSFAATTTTTQEAPADKGGVARNIAAGTLEGEAGVMNVLSDPYANLVARPLATAGSFLYDRGAKATGLYNPLSPEQRADLLGDDYMPQPGTRAINALGAVVGGKPSDVTATTPGERIARAGAAGVAASPLIPGGILAPVIGGSAAVAGEEAARQVPDWAKPGTELAVNLLTGLAIPFGAAGVKAGGGPVGRAINAYVNAPGEGLIPGRSQPPPSGGGGGGGGPAAGGGPQPGMGAAQPVGAQVTPAGAAGFSPAEEAAYRATAEGQKFLERQEPNVPDRNSYVPGVTPNAAEQEQTVTMARELKSLGIASTEVSEEAKAAAFANNEARQQYLERTVKSPVDVANAEAARDSQTQTDLKAAWANKTAADASPVIDLADQIKASPDGRRPAVRKAVDSVTSELTDADGKLLTDPEQLYGVRKHLDDLLSKEGQRETPLSARATASLQALKGQLDTSIEAAAPGFKQYLKNYSDASRGIDEMQVLQGHEKGLYDSQGRLTYNKFQTMMRNIVDSRNSSGLNPYKSITPETMERLWNLRDDLRRSSSALELARAPGSDTASNAVDLAKQYAKMGGQAAVMGIAHAIAPVAGPVAVRGVQAAVAPLRAAGLARRQAQRAHELLYPTNPLQPPSP